MSTLRVGIDRQRCIGAGQCVFTAPELFTQGPDGLGRVVSEHVGQDVRPSLREAAHACPVQAVAVQER